jgi:hypothetical protein
MIKVSERRGVVPDKLFFLTSHSDGRRGPLIRTPPHKPPHESHVGV